MSVASRRRLESLCLTLLALLVSTSGGGSKKKTQGKSGNMTTTTTTPAPRTRGCFVQQRIVWVPIPKYKYVDAPLAEPVYQKKPKMKVKVKGKMMTASGGMQEVPISRYTSSNHYGDF